MGNAAHPARGSPPYAQRLSAREAVVLMLAQEGRPVPAEAERGNRGVQRGSVSTESELGFGHGGGNGRACPDRAWVKMMVAAVGVAFGGGTVHSQDSWG